MSKCAEYSLRYDVLEIVRHDVPIRAACRWCTHLAFRVVAVCFGIEHEIVASILEIRCLCIIDDIRFNGIARPCSYIIEETAYTPARTIFTVRNSRYMKCVSYTSTT